ncbi:CDF family cation-efflux transporter FieF [Enterovibrio nigricans]|uniref:Cation-efflux pump FieF n=1 Tax=Enterovibrio nigricans DSM 22720 TaxID=1121868 RepID=A0A1T4U9G9_9GAMM|nr:CDF family cation-efflux transporter FieF [Enterovibrio nigricans]PKF50017.1 cation-efflux pump FieF [Enterovibrio nigricans]SKA49250.1 ferrous-iron efflux pump FieF [Enterovibrio nigricans DSM 22720]
MNQKYARLVQMAAWAATITATVLLLMKIFTWWYTDSISLLASLVDSLIDLLASITNLVVVRYALQPADEEHRFGHGKAESLAALAQAAFIVGSAFFLVLSGFERLYNPADLHNPGVGVAVSAIATVFTGFLVLFQKWVVRKTGSQAISADSLHYQTDLLMNLAIMAALGLAWYGIKMADAVFAIGIGIFILYSAVRMAYDAVQSLLDRQLPMEEQDKIMLLSSTVAGVHGVHDLRTRQAGPTRFIQLHLELDDELKLVDAHLIADEVEDRLEVAFPGADIIIHQDPVSVVGK